MKLEVNLPFIIEVDDYHAFGHIQDLLKNIFGPKIKVKELAYEDPFGNYYGIIYYGKQDDAYRMAVKEFYGEEYD